MAALADAIELFLHILSRDNQSKPVCESSTIHYGMMMCYVAFGFLGLVVYTKHSDKDFSGILTASALVQLLGFGLLTIKVRATKSVAGISSKTLEMYALFFLCRLASTTVHSGYVPGDKSGRYVYQMLDGLSFFVVLQLLWCIHKTYRWTYQAEEDNFLVFPLIPPCLVLGWFLHADLNQSFVYDVVWAVSTYIDTLAMLPQLWMMTKIGGQVEGCTAHFTCALVASRAMALAFWLMAYEDLRALGHLTTAAGRRYTSPLAEEDVGATLAAKMIVGANGVQLLLAADFLYYYARARFQGKSVVLPDSRLGSSPQDI